MDSRTHWALPCAIEKVMIPSSTPPTQQLSPLFIRAHVRILIRNAWKAHASASVFLVSHRGGRGPLAGEVSFICIWHTSLLCYSDSTIILITVCLPLPLRRLLFLLLQFLRSGKMRRFVYSQICPPRSRRKIKKKYVVQINGAISIKLLCLQSVDFFIACSLGFAQVVSNFKFNEFSFHCQQNKV